MEFLLCLLGLLPVVPVVLLAADRISRLLFVIAVALAFLPACEPRSLKLLKVATPHLRKVGLVGTRRLHERLVLPGLMLLGQIPRTATTARRILRIIGC